ncbi:MAG: band-7 C-terminal domain-containing protein [Burkholderiales bacterium]
MGVSASASLIRYGWLDQAIGTNEGLRAVNLKVAEAYVDEFWELAFQHAALFFIPP